MPACMCNNGTTARRAASLWILCRSIYCSIKVERRNAFVRLGCKRTPALREERNPNYTTCFQIASIMVSALQARRSTWKYIARMALWVRLTQLGVSTIKISSESWTQSRRQARPPQIRWFRIQLRWPGVQWGSAIGVLRRVGHLGRTLSSIHIGPVAGCAM